MNMEMSERKRALLTQRLKKARAVQAQVSALNTIPKRPAETAAPLSFAQQRMWFLEQWADMESTYHISLGLRLRGTLDVAALVQALRDIVARHEVLRMGYGTVDGLPTLHPLPEPELQVTMVDLRSETAVSQQTHIAKAVQQPFQLAHDLPLRATLFHCDTDEYVLLLVLHHIASDGWSLTVLCNELAVFYTAHLTGAAPKLPDLPIQYDDYAYWQRDRLQGEFLQTQLAFWQDKLDGAPDILNLPLDRLRPAVQTYRGATESFVLPSNLSQLVKHQSQAEGLTPFMTLLAAYQALLARISGQQDILVGVPVAGRSHPELENLIGLFVNTLVYRAQLSPNMHSRDLRRQIRDSALDIHAHQDLPFEKLVEALEIDRNLSHSPIFQVLFNYHNTPLPNLSMPGLAVDYIVPDSGQAKFDLGFALEETAAGIEGVVTYNKDLFTTDKIRRLIGQYQTLLRGMVTQPDCPIAQLPLLTAKETQQILADWNETAVSHPPYQAVHQLITAQATKRPDTIAAVCEGVQLTYGELNERANQLAHYLRAHDVGPEVPVGLLVERSLDILIGMLGVLKAGGAYVPLDPVYPQNRLRFMLDDAGVAILLTQQHLLPELPPLPNVMVTCLDQDWAEIAAHPSHEPSLQVTPDNLMYILFTSGSTGQPKGVAVQHGNYLNYIQGLLPQLAVTAESSFAIVSTFAADLGSTNVYGALCSGGTIHILPYERAVDPVAFAAYFRQHRIDTVKLVPSHFAAMQGLPNLADVIPQQRLVFAGEASQWEMVEKVRELRPDCQIQNHYGPTETTVSMLAYPVPDVLPSYHTDTVPLGRPFPNVRTYILDAHLQPVPVGVSGELYIGGPGVARGYLKRPGLTAEKFVPDPFARIPGNRLYRTGDRARYVPDGNIEFLGRVDHQVKIRGYRVEPGGIETMLVQQPGVQEAAVVVRAEKPGEKQLVAYVVPEADALLSIAALRDALRAQLPDYMIPNVFVLLDALPLNPNGKIDRKALPAPDPTQRMQDGFVAPRNAREAAIAAIWADVFGVAEIGIDDNFFDLGGESFKAIRVVRQIGEDVPVMALFRYPTIRMLAAYLDEEMAVDAQLLHQLTAISSEKCTASLVCFPYGGGSAVTFQPLANAISPDLALYAVEIPGHDFSRPDEPLASVTEVAARCVAEIREKVTGPIVLYGHCLGGALAVETARQLRNTNLPVLGVMLAGTFPQARPPGKLFDLMARFFPTDRWVSNRDYHDFLRGLGGFTDLINPAEQEFVMRALRHDVREAEAYYTQAFVDAANHKLDVPIFCIVGDADRATELYQERYREWEFFSDDVNLAVIGQAGHYFLKHQAQELSALIKEQLDSWQTPSEPDHSPSEPASSTPVDTHTAQAVPRWRSFFLVALGQIVSMIGTSLTSFALGVWVYQQTGSVSDFAYISVFVLLPGILVSPVAGAVADRWNRRLVMISSDTVAALATLLVAILFWNGSLQIWHIYVTASIGSIANAFQRPAYTAAIAQLVPKAYLGHANGFAQLGLAVGELIAPLMGGALLVTIKVQGIVLIDFFTFLVAMTTLLLVRFPDLLFHKQEEPLIKEIVQGWHYIIKRPSMVAMVIYFVVFNFFLAIGTVLITPLVLSFASPVVLGAVTAAGGVGMLAGSLVMSWWGGTKRRAEGMIGFTTLMGTAMVILGLRPAPVFAAVGIFGVWFALALVNAHWQALIQTKVGLELQGRVVATNQMLAWSMMPLGFMLTGPLADRFFEPLMAGSTLPAALLRQLLGAGSGRGMGLLVIVTGLILIIWGLLGYRWHSLRYMEDILPDAIPDAIVIKDKDILQAQADRILKNQTKERKSGIESRQFVYQRSNESS